MSNFPQYPPIQQYPPDYSQRPSKAKSTAIILELLPGLFGFYGIGWIYANKVGTGVGILVGGLVWAVIAIITDIITGGFAFICTIPINIIAVTTSTILINNYTKQHPELFG